MSSGRLAGASAATGIFALALVAAAAAAAPQPAEVKYLTNKGRRPAGLRIKFDATAATRVTVSLRGARADTAAGRRCSLPKEQASACPEDTRIDSRGTDIKAFLHAGGIYFVLPAPGLVLDSTLSRRGTLTIDLTPAGTALISFRVKLKKVRRRRKALITSPRCGRTRRFRVVTTLDYADGTSRTVTTRQTCRR